MKRSTERFIKQRGDSLTFTLGGDGDEEAEDEVVDPMHEIPSIDVAGLLDGVDWDLIENGGEEEVAPYLVQPLRPQAEPVRVTPTTDDLFAPLPGDPPIAGGEVAAKQQQQPQEDGRSRIERLVDPSHSTLTFASLLADSLDDTVENLLVPGTTRFTPRIYGLLQKARREVVRVARHESITLDMLIYDNVLNDEVRVKFAEYIKYRTLKDSSGSAYASSVYERRTPGGRAPGSVSSGYRLSTNHRLRRFNTFSWKYALQWFRSVFTVPNPLIARYEEVLAQATARLTRLNGGLNRATSSLGSVNNKRRRGGGGDPSDAATRRRPDSAVARLAAIRDQASDAIEALNRYMPRIVMPGFVGDEDDFDEFDNYY